MKNRIICGPLVLTDYEHVQSFGTTTLSGSLTITLTSRWPVDGLLEAVQEILQQV